MPCPKKSNDGNSLSRRSFLGIMALAIGGSMAGCSSLQLVLKTYPNEFDYDNELRNRMLIAFVRTVVPGAPIDSPHLTDVFVDDFYPFHEYCGYFLWKLAETTQEIFGHADFDRLDLPGRTAVVEHGLDQGGPAGRLVTSAVFMAQYSFYAGIYHDERGCPLIDFPGTNDGYAPNSMSVAEIETHLAPSQTSGGHPA